MAFALKDEPLSFVFFIVPGYAYAQYWVLKILLQERLGPNELLFYNTI